VVEIQSHSGAKARKEYDAPTINAAWQAMVRDLAHYPDFRIADIWIKDDHVQKDSRPTTTYITLTPLTTTYVIAPPPPPSTRTAPAIAMRTSSTPAFGRPAVNETYGSNPSLFALRYRWNQ
jgi:hypothetical protein